MSRIGKKPITIPPGVTAELKDEALTVKGPKGELSLNLLPVLKVEKTDSEILVNVSKPELKQQKALWGLYRSLISNMIAGVTLGFTKILEINGVGFKAEVKGKTIVLNLGYSHAIELDIPSGLEVKVEKNVVTITGIDKQLVGQFAAVIRSKREPEPYKGKGIKYQDEVIRRKAGKVVKAVGGGK